MARLVNPDGSVTIGILEDVKKKAGATEAKAVEKTAPAEAVAKSEKPKKK